MITELRHTGIVVSNIERAVHFYCDLLGLKLIKDVTEESAHIDKILGLSNVRLRMVRLLSRNNIQIELLHFIKPHAESVSPPVFNLGCSHVAFTVDHLDQDYEKLVKEGIRFNCPPCLSPDGAVKYAYCQDPDGTFIELVEAL
ncbi:MAG: VOC family protein [Deltaproteobacteria bacterium]|nr:VOC family protein [Deltaproteobacteria bacterium]